MDEVNKTRMFEFASASTFWLREDLQVWVENSGFLALKNIVSTGVAAFWKSVNEGALGGNPSVWERIHQG